MRAVLLEIILVTLLAASGCKKEVAPVAPEPCKCSKDCCQSKAPQVVKCDRCDCTAPPDHFWDGKRLDAVTEIAGACSDMSQFFFAEAGKEPPCNVDRKIEYRKRIARAVRSVNRHLPLIGAEFDKPFSLYIQLHRSFCEAGLLNCGDYREMAAAVENALDPVLKAALVGDAPPDLPLAAIRFKARIKMSPEEYIEAAFKHWQRSQRPKEDAQPK